MTTVTFPRHSTGREDFLDDYQEAAARTDQNSRDGMEGLAFPLLGLFGEVGSLVSALKKKQREKDSYVGYSEAVIEEFGDVLWYLSNAASRASIQLSALIRLGGQAFHVDEVDAHEEQSSESSEFEAAVIALAGEAGLLLNEFGKGTIRDDRNRLSAHLTNILRALFRAAALAGIDLEQAARSNVHKVNSRWPTTRQYTPLFDAICEETEQLPRRIDMHIVEAPVADKLCVIQVCNGVEVGSRLTDNKVVEDDYRFHDVFHLAYAAVLGWSPCLRALLKVKRKSRPDLDEAQDGARAILIEEGVSTMIFHHALKLNHFVAVQSLDYSLLKAVRDFVDGYEVDQCPLWQWEEAILNGFEVFRKLRTHRRGIVTANLVDRSITYTKYPDDR